MLRDKLKNMVEKFLFLVIDGARNRATPDEMSEINQFNEKLRHDGNWITAAGIAGFNDAIIIDNRANNFSIENKSLIDGPENYTGFWIIEADSQSHALELAKAASRACNRRIEIRPYLR